MRFASLLLLFALAHTKLLYSEPIWHHHHHHHPANVYSKAALLSPLVYKCRWTTMTSSPQSVRLLHYIRSLVVTYYPNTRPQIHNNLVDTLRRQLMHDNYDYMTFATDELPSPAPRVYDDGAPANAHGFQEVPPHIEGDYFPAPEPAPLPPKPLSEPRGYFNQRKRNKHLLEIETRSFSKIVPYQRVESNIPVSHKDLYYYVGDALLNAGAGVADGPAFNALDVADAPDNDFDDDLPPNPPPPKKKYTILEIEGGSEARRNGGSSRRRFVQEEGEDGIAIVSLDNAPFPEFRLPTDRRQYMHHEDHEYPPNQEADAPNEEADTPNQEANTPNLETEALNLGVHEPNLEADGPSSQQKRALSRRHALEHSQQKDELLYLP